MRIPIHYKITLIFGAISALVLLGIFFYLDASLSRHAYQRIRNDLLERTAFVRSFIEKHYEQEVTSPKSDDLADDIGSDLGIRVTIIGTNGTVLGDSELDGPALAAMENHLDRPEVQAALHTQNGEARRYSTTAEKDMLYIAQSFSTAGSRGVVRLSIPLSEIELLSKRLERLLIVMLCIALALVLAASFVASILISRPIQKISSVANAIASGDFSKKLSMNSRDEIGDLARAVDNMSAQIRRRIEEFASSNSRLEAVLLSIFEGLMVVDGNGAILLINQALKKLLLLEEDPAGKTPIEAIGNIEIQKIAETALHLKSGVTSQELTLVLPEQKDILVHATPVIIDGRAEGAVLVFHDITELRKLEGIRREFVANVSHELRTPVASIKGYSETLLDGALDDAAHARDFVKTIYTDSGRLERLVNDLLDLSRIESGKLQLNTTPCSVGPIVERIVSSLQKQLHDKAMKFHTRIPKDLPNIIADQDKISQVLFNLIDNAMKYTPQEGSIFVSAEEKDGFVCISVSDNGIGIPREDIDRIFERFYRVDKARSRELGGTGLGLSIVKHIVQAHGGEVSVTSEPGTGTTFSFTIPRT